MHAWRENEKFFEGYRDNPQVAHDVAFNANDLGADADMDSQGRVLFNTTLRKELDLQNQELHIYAYRGQADAAFEWLEKAYQEKGTVIFSMKVDPMWDPVRNDPRFVDLLQRARLE
jgi:DNA-binding transcriptional regulator/RsmH inhibitor MraZ